jgi:hypothetical protein
VITHTAQESSANNNFQIVTDQYAFLVGVVNLLLQLSMCISIVASRFGTESINKC